MKENVFIIGTGLIGGSLGLALKDSPLVNRIFGYDVNIDFLKVAYDIGAIDDKVDLIKGTLEADIIFLCTPLSCYQKIITQIKPYLTSGTIVTDVGSTKQEVMDLFAQQLPDDVFAIGGHPMAGSEIKGINGADRYLFENAVYGITPGKVKEDVVRRLTDIIKATGAKIKVLDAKYHDEIVAAVSHVPHLAAVALVNSTKGNNDYLSMAAGGFRDTTRIASSNPSLWEDILLFNRYYILSKLENFIDELTTLKLAISTSAKEELSHQLNEAKTIRDNIPYARKGLIPGFHDIVCIVPDKPGIIGRLGNLLGQEKINIVDIEILRVREGDGGTIRIGVPTFKEAGQAVEILKNNEIKAWIR